MVQKTVKTIGSIGIVSLVCYAVLSMSLNTVSAKPVTRNTILGSLLKEVAEQKKNSKKEETTIISVNHVTKKRIVTFTSKLSSQKIIEYENTYKLDFKTPGNKENQYVIIPQDANLFERFVSDVKVVSIHNDDEYKIDAQTTDWGVSKINAPSAWNAALPETGDSITVAVIDSGVDATHPDLAGAVLPGGYDFINIDADPTDDNGHGTHVAGIIAAANNTDGTVGAAFGAKILPFKVCDDAGFCDSLAITDAIDAATAADVDIINMSLGGPTNALIQQAINDATAAGIIVVASAGNENANHCLYPAAYSNVICVGAVTDTDTKASFSNYGPELDAVTPGVGILSSQMGGGTLLLSGTSMAAPYYSGAAALVASSIKDYCVTTPADPACSDIRGYTQGMLALIAVRDLGTPGRDDTFGYGIVDLSPLWGVVSIVHPTPIATVQRGSTYTMNVNVTNNDTDVVSLKSCTITSRNLTHTQTVPSFVVTTLQQGPTPYTAPVNNGLYATFTFPTPIEIPASQTIPFSYSFSGSSESMPFYDTVLYDFTCTYDRAATAEVESYTTPTDGRTAAIDWPDTLKRVYFTFGRLRYNQYVYASQLRNWDTIYIKNFDPNKVQYRYMFLYDYTKRGNQGYTSYWKSSTSMIIRTNYLLPSRRQYAYVMIFRDKATGLEIKKYFVFHTR